MTNLEKATKLCAELSLEEKVGQITHQIPGFEAYERVDDEFIFSKELEKIAKETGVGVISALFRGDPWTKKGYGNGVTLEEREKMIREFQDFVMDHSKHRIPVLIDIEASHGMQSLGSVMYPTGLGAAAAFAPELYGRMMHRIGQELKASGNHIALVTMIDLARDPRWGRSEECYGEDTYLASRYAYAGCRGLKEAGVIACAKHFFGAGDSEGGGNAMPITTSEREIREILLPPAKAAMDGGCDMMMVAYNALNGEPIHLSKHYLTEVLQEELGYEGILLSDGNGIYSAATQVEISNAEAAIRALKAGVHISLQDAECFSTLLETAKESEELQALIDRACIKVLEKKYELGLFENPYISQEALAEFMPNEKGRELAYEMAAESITLVKNENQLLPLKPNTKICILGENGANIYALLGDYTSDRKEGEGTTIWEGIQAAFPNAVYERGWSYWEEDFDATCLKAVEDCEVVVLCMGGSSVRHGDVKFLANGAMEQSETFIDCGEGGDLAGLTLPKVQEKLLDAVRDLGKPVVTLFVIGRAYAITPLIEKSDASLICWYPGQEGGSAIADVLTGKVNPSGKLPVSLPRTPGCVPACYNTYVPNRRYCDAQEMENRYSFGFGLSYTTFAYGMPKVQIEGGAMSIEGCLVNSGERAGKETVLVFIHKVGGSVRHRAWELVRFEKIALQPGEERTYHFTIPLVELQDVINGELPDGFVVRVGGQTAEITL